MESGKLPRLRNCYVEKRFEPLEKGRGEMDNLQSYKQRFKKGIVVTHVNGGRGEILDLQNDWSTSPPKVVAIVRVLDTVFHDIRTVSILDLQQTKDKS